MSRAPSHKSTDFFRLDLFDYSAFKRDIFEFWIAEEGGTRIIVAIKRIRDFDACPFKANAGSPTPREEVKDLDR